MTNDLSRRRTRTTALVVLVLVALSIVTAFVGSGALGGTPIQDAVDGWLSADGTPLAPGTGAFSIWSVIYLGLSVLAVLQLLPSRLDSERYARTRTWIAASALLNAAWIWTVQGGFLALSLVVIVILLAVLGRTIALLNRDRPAGLVDAVFLDGTMGLYLGWVAVATVANVSALLASHGFKAFGLPTDLAAGLVLGVAALIGVATAVGTGGRWTPSLALSWGLAWIGVGRLDGGLVSTPIAITAFCAAGVVLLATAAVRMLGRHPGASTSRTEAASGVLR
ncbi:TspO/MBR family protein [Paeniglutamicibacter cryotolerans]|uniref:Tryptophan-rich sensory protein n=1 Tax=Paeniglutamicibacter cryotolerans TaxID=670079 RepID=A0A839QEC5_9MICC|nr:TspO/MBR family protein [Paeniglutamicibacter cryotolerans]MBB2994608.1 hypothetical protein [Paeniglutamicibacter cryotolerans]